MSWLDDEYNSKVPDNKKGKSWLDLEYDNAVNKSTINQKIVSSYEPPKNYEVIPNLLPQSPKSTSTNNTFMTNVLKTPVLDPDILNLTKPKTVSAPTLNQNLDNYNAIKNVEKFSSKVNDKPLINAFKNLPLATQNYYLKYKDADTKDKTVISNIGKIVNTLQGQADKSTPANFWDKFSSTLRKTAFGEDLQTQDYKKSTGSGVKDVLANIGGTAAGFGVPSGSGGSAMTLFNKVGEKVAEKVTPKITSIIGSKVSGNLLPKILTKGAINATRGAAEGLGTGVYENIVTPNMTAEERLKSLGVNTLMGAGIGGAIGAASPIVSKAIPVLKSNIIGDNPLPNILNKVQENKIYKAPDVPLSAKTLEALPTSNVTTKLSTGNTLLDSIRQNAGLTPKTSDAMMDLMHKPATIEPAIIEVSEELTPPIKSNRQLPKGLSDAEFDKYYKLDQTPSKKAIETMVEDIGARVINKYKTNDIPTIAKSYINKYNLPDNVKVSFTLKNDLNKATTQPIRDLNGNVIGARININPNQSIEGKVGALRHEIEHYKDLVEGYAEASNKYKYNPKVDKTAKDLYTNASKGHHKNYGWFEYDYLKKAIQEDNLQPTESIVKPQKEASNIVNTPQINNAQNVNKTVAREYMKPLDEPRITGSDIAAEGQTNTRGFSKNIKTDENTNKDIREYFTEKPIEYNRLENKKLAEHAQTRFKNEKLDNLVTEFKTKTNFKPEDVPLARLIANEVAKNGDIKTASEIVSKIAEKLTESGQFSQAAKVLRKSNPSALMEYLQRSIVKLNEKGAEKYGSKWKNINLSEQVQKEIYNLKLFDEEAIEKAMNKAHDDINTQLPASNMEKLDAWRRMAMLLNPKTHIRNVLGNALMMPARGISETMSTVAESVMLKNKPELRTKSFGYKNNKAIVKTVEETWNTLKDDLINGSGRYDIESALSVGNKEKRIFKNNMLEKINVKSKEWLNKGDEIFMQKAFKDSLGGYMKVQNLTEATTEAIEYATKKAQEATYRQANAFADWLNKAKRSTTKGGKVGGFVADVTVPFVKTPANILKTSYEYSPMGFLSLAKSGKTASEAIDIITKGLTGTGLFVAGIALANMGWARSARENSKNAEALNQMEGQNYNSIITPWGSYSFDWASPIAVPLAMGISVVEGFDKKNVSNSWIDKFTNVLYNTGNAGLDSLVNMSMLQGIKDTLGGYGSNMDKLMGVPQDFLSQMIPTLSNQIARTVDPVKRNTYDPNPVKSFGKTLVNKIPFASKTLEPKVDTMGKEVTTGSAGTRVLQNFISPGTAMSKNDDSNIKELSRLYDKNKDTAILPKVAPKSFKIDGEDKLLTPKELTQFQKTMGENELKGLTKALGNKNDDKKTKDLTKLATESYSKAKVELLKNRGIKTYVKKSVIPVNSLKIKP